MPVEDVEEGESRSFLRAHMAIGPIFFGLLLMAGIWRAVLWESGRGVSWEYLLAISLVVLVMGLQGYLGGELVYRYGAEVEMNYRELPVGGAKSSVPALPGATAAPKATAWGNLEARRE